MNLRITDPENQYPSSTAWYIEVTLSSGHIRRGSAVAIRLSKPSDKLSKTYLLTCRHLTWNYLTAEEQEHGNETIRVTVQKINAYRHYTGYAESASKRVKVLDLDPLPEHGIQTVEYLSGSTDWVLLEFVGDKDTSAYSCVRKGPLSQDGTIEIVGFPGGSDAFTKDHIVRATRTRCSNEYRLEGPGFKLLNGNGTRAGMSGSGVFKNLEFIGIHRLRDDKTQQLELVEWNHIQSRLRECGYNAVLDSFPEDIPSYNHRTHSLGKRLTDLQSVRETKLFRLLESKNDANLSDAVRLVCDEAMDQTRRCQCDSGVPFIDWQHGIYAAEAMYAILPEPTATDLHKHEIAALLLTAFLHDLSIANDYAQPMALTPDDAYTMHQLAWRRKYENYAHTRKYGSEEECAQLDLAWRFEYIAEKHARDADSSVLQFLRSTESASSLPNGLEDLVIRIVKLHHCESIADEERTFIDSTPSIDGEPVCAAFILAILKIADRLSFSLDLLPRSIFREIRPGGRVTLQKWREHFLPSNTEVLFENGTIALAIPCEEPEYLDAGMEYAASIEQSIRSTLRLLRSSNPPSGRSLDADIEIRTEAIAPKDNSFLRVPLEFRLDRQAISDLLLTQELYQDKSLCIRELVQNAVDACTLAKEIRECNEVPDKYEPTMRLEHGVEQGREYLICEDNGSGMSLGIIQNYLTRIGKSYYQSDEFRKRHGNPTKYIARYGIGFASCFMLGDRVEIETRFLGEDGILEDPLRVEVLGIDGKMAIRNGNRQKPGTLVKIWIREQQTSELPQDKLDLIETLSLFCSNSPVRIDAVELLGEKKRRQSFSRMERLVLPEIPHLVSKCLLSYVSEITDPNGEVEGWVRTFIPLNSWWRDMLNHLRRDIRKSSAPQIVRDFYNSLFDRYVPLPSPAARITENSHEVSVSTELETEESKDSAYRDRWSEPYTLHNRILFDGMLVSTTDVSQFGRHGSFYRRFVCDELLVNVTGSAKGKLTPARTPPSRLETDSSWKKIRRLILCARAGNWIKIADARMLSWRDFWEHIGNYRVEIAYCSTPEAVNQLAFPCSNSRRTINLGKTKRLYVGDSFRSKVPHTGWLFGLGLRVGMQEDRRNSDWVDRQIVKTLALHSTVTRVQGKLAFDFDEHPKSALSAFDRVLANGDPVLNKDSSQELWCVPFTGEIESFFGIAHACHNSCPLLNQSHPLVSLHLGGMEGDTVPHTVHRFADLLIRYSLGYSSVYFDARSSDAIWNNYQEQIRVALSAAFVEAYDDMKQHAGMLPPYKILGYREDLAISERWLRSWK